MVLICSLVLANCAFPVRPGYDRKSGSYKRYRVPKQEIVEADTTTVNSQEELVQEEILAAASKNTENIQTDVSDSVDTSQNSTATSANKELARNGDSTKVVNGDTTNVAGSATAKNTEKQSEKLAQKSTDKTTAKKTDKKEKKQTKVAKPTNLEKYAKEWLGAKYVYGAASKKRQTVRAT